MSVKYIKSMILLGWLFSVSLTKPVIVINKSDQVINVRLINWIDGYADEHWIQLLPDQQLKHSTTELWIYPDKNGVHYYKSLPENMIITFKG